MLATVPLLSAEEIKRIAERGGEMLTNFMDDSSECISLSTASFDYLPPEAQASLREAMEIHLKMFGSTYVAILHMGVVLKKPDKAGEAIKEVLELLGRKLAEM